MARVEHRTYSKLSLEALNLLGKQIQLARKQRRITAAELAERAGISRSTLQRIERGDPKVEIGITFEAAIIVGVSLFDVGISRLSDKIERVDDKIALLPKSVRKSPEKVNDAF